MYLTQTSFLGKTGPLDPSRVINLDPPVGDRDYPNRWSEERNLKSLHNRVNSLSLMSGRGLGGRSRVTLANTGGQTLNKLNVANQKYLAILYEYVQQDHVWKLLKWLNTISEEHKKGLRVIKTIIDVKGTKRFKMGGANASYNSVQTKNSLQSACEVDQLDLDGAREFFRKQQTRTAYGTMFGEIQKTHGDQQLLKNGTKKFSETEYTKFVQKLPAQYIDKWISLNKSAESCDEFIKRLINTTRELYTVIKNQVPTVSTKHDIFRGVQSKERVPRFDKMILNATEIPRASSTNDQKLHMERNIVNNNLSQMILKQKEMKQQYPHEFKADDFKQKFLRGQPYNITSYIELKQPKKTSYQVSMAGLQAKDKAQIVDLEHNSCGIGGVIPDPMTMTSNKNRLMQFSDDLRHAEKKEFYYTGEASAFDRI